MPFIISARKTSRLIDERKAAEWTGSPKTDPHGQCEFRYQPEGWDQAYRFVALRYGGAAAKVGSKGDSVIVGQWRSRHRSQSRRT